ncbi:GTP-binding protein TypA/BipA [Botrimarina colliarenosi]|uniref:Large ribosomal subunit assembly factor BipA n=1 Tax=Botrimarina colliarenosi TaxID=2528001 RepID=A0A5C6A9C3_9BACT|nr:translational GTPase TypA [Botrimarina colliarenosi]TWT96000.1 GTP-binding protein TypA/BipA [Botrimarina colliarenosi]
MSSPSRGGQPALRNVAIIAHVDHGKTTLVDQLLYQSGRYRDAELDKLAGGQHGLVFDSNDLERERGITIFSKNCAIGYESLAGDRYRINLIDTPGHADFGGEVERVLMMADGALLVVDAFDGPMPQTRFVLQKALAQGLQPIIVVNKIDRPDARPDEVVTEIFDLLVDLGADDHVLDFPVVFASAKQGYAGLRPDERPADMRALLEKIVTEVPAPRGEPDEPTQVLITTIDYSDYVGRIAVGRVLAGAVVDRQRVAVLNRDGDITQQQIGQLFTFDGLGKVQAERVECGDLCAIVGLDPIGMGYTVAAPEAPRVAAAVTIDEPTLHMMFRVNDGPFAGKEGDHVTSRKIGERLERELRSDVALRVSPGDTMEQYRVAGRGLMHLGILIENFRREGFELCVGKPQVVSKFEDGKRLEPVELLVVDVPEEFENAVMSLVGDRRAQVLKMGKKTSGASFTHLEFSIPSRSLIGLRTRLLAATQGNAVVHHTVLGFEPPRGSVTLRANGVMIASEPGQATAYAMDALDDRGVFFVRPGDQVYEGQIVGENCKSDDIVVNVVKGKKLTNMRASGKDDNSQVRPPRDMSLEACLEYIDDDELVEVTPTSIRMRKVILNESSRRRESRRAAAVTTA